MAVDNDVQSLRQDLAEWRNELKGDLEKVKAETEGLRAQVGKVWDTVEYLRKTLQIIIGIYILYLLFALFVSAVSRL